MTTLRAGSSIECMMSRAILFAAILVPLTATIAVASEQFPEGWTTASPRDELRPEFSYSATGGRSAKGALVIEHDEREGLDGRWTKTFEVAGGRHFRFQAFRRTTDVKTPRQSALVQITWQNDKGELVPYDHQVVDFYRNGKTSLARPEFPIQERALVLKQARSQQIFGRSSGGGPPCDASADSDSCLRWRL